MIVPSAFDGVSAARHALSSRMVRSLACPIPATIGTRHRQIARARARSARHARPAAPPPRINWDDVGWSVAAADLGECVGDGPRRLAALERHRERRVAQVAAILQPLQLGADIRPSRRAIGMDDGDQGDRRRHPLLRVVQVLVTQGLPDHLEAQGHDRLDDRGADADDLPLEMPLRMKRRLHAEPTAFKRRTARKTDGQHVRRRCAGRGFQIRWMAAVSSMSRRSAWWNRGLSAAIASRCFRKTAATFAAVSVRIE